MVCFAKSFHHFRKKEWTTTIFPSNSFLGWAGTHRAYLMFGLLAASAWIWRGQKCYSRSFSIPSLSLSPSSLSLTHLLTHPLTHTLTHTHTSLSFSLSHILHLSGRSFVGSNLVTSKHARRQWIMR